MPDLLPVLAAVIAAALTLAAGQAGVLSAFGAHPAWATQVTWIGIPVGLLGARLCDRAGVGRRSAGATFIAITIAALLLARFGKSEFAASYAENSLAGRFWYIV